MRDQQPEISIEDDDSYVGVDPEAHKERVREIVSYQKSLCLLPPPPILSSASASTSSRSLSSTIRRSRNLLELMKVGGMSLGRLFDMEHTSLASHLNDYSGSPVTRPIFLCGSDSSEELACNWSPVKSFRRSSGEDGSRLDTSWRESMGGDVSGKEQCKGRQKLTRKRSHRALPRFRRCSRGFRMPSRLRRLKVMMCHKFL